MSPYPRRLPIAAVATVLLGSALAMPTARGQPDIGGPEPAYAADPVDDVETIAVGDAQKPETLFGNLRRDADVFTLVNARNGLSFHKPMYIMPLTWSPDYSSEHTEVLFQISLKQRLFNRNFFFGYTQKSFWQLYDGDASRPFRETNYNPELFYRWKPQWQRAPGLGFDIGFDHKSNGKELPDSRSWNRIVFATFLERATTLIHLRAWYRLPEDEDRADDDPKRDDNPDIYQYYGYGELRLQQRFGRSNQMLSLMARGNPTTGRGAVQLAYSAPFSDELFWNVYVWHGYGESLADYDDSVTRVGIGLMLAR